MGELKSKIFSNLNRNKLQNKFNVNIKIKVGQIYYKI